MTPKQITIHHSASSRDKTTVANIDAWHKLRWVNFRSSLGYWVGYHYVITGDGKVTQTRRDNEIGAHCVPNNGKIGICLTGNFMIEEPSQAQLESMRTVVDNLSKTYNISSQNIKAHRELSKTDCPGDNLYKVLLQDKISWLRQLIEKLINLWK